jgi:hypothetical protein
MLVLPALASADLTVKEKTYARAFLGMWSSTGEEVTYVKGDMMRNESQTEKKGMTPGKPIDDPPPAVSIIRLDKGVIWYLNLMDKTYMERPLEPEHDPNSDAYHFGLKDMKVTRTEKTKEIMGLKCTATKVTVAFETSLGDEGENLVQTVDLVFWMTSEAKALDDLRKFWENMIEMSQGKQQGYPMGDAVKELWAELGEEGEVPMAMEMLMGRPDMDAEQKADMKAQMEAMKEYMSERTGEDQTVEEADDDRMKITREIIAISDEKLDASLFEVPEDFKKAPTIRMW